MGTRDSIEIQPFEIPWRNTATTFPAPSYSDDNIKVYAIPVSPFTHLLPVVTPPAASTSTEEPTLDLSGKRKREPSSEYPSKRINTGNETPTRAPNATKAPLSESLLSKLREVDNTPEALEGDYAEEYRKAIIQVMFPGTNINTGGEATDVLKGNRKGKKSGSAGTCVCIFHVSGPFNRIIRLQMRINFPSSFQKMLM